MKVRIQNQQTMVRMQSDMRKILKETIQAIGIKFGISPEDEVSLLITDDKEITRLNREYRGLSRPTDVLSFAMNEGDEVLSGMDGKLWGDIVISAERAQAQALEYGHGMRREMTFLTVHGMLHLLGYDHDSPTEAAEMEGLQKDILDQLGIERE